jgi:Flp pilus assembly pilin Flp
MIERKSVLARAADAIKHLVIDEDGPTTAEYAVMLAIIIVAAVVGLSTFGDGVHGLYVSIESALTIS